MPRLVIPAGETPQDKAPWGPTWQQVADTNQVEIAVLGDEWCKANNHAEGLGIVGDYVAPAPFVPQPDPTPSVALPTVDPALVATAEASVAQLSTDLQSALDPNVANPTTAQRLATLEATVALLIAQQGG